MKIKKGDKVKIISSEEEGNVLALSSDSAMIKKDKKVQRKFVTVKLKDLEKLKKTRNYIKH